MSFSSSEPQSKDVVLIPRRMLLGFVESAEALRSECLGQPTRGPEKAAVLDELDALIRAGRGVLGG